MNRNRTHDKMLTLHGLGLAALATFLLLVGAAGTASAYDGVLEINGSCAINSGCFPGDTPGYPVTITSSAGSQSFRLTSDLVVPSTSTDGILVGINDASIDLGGFSILGTTCVGSTTNCTPGSASSGDGIDVTGIIFGLSVSNGQIVGMGRHGVNVGTQARIQNLTSRWNASFGMNSGPGALVMDSTFYQNGGTGVVLGSNSAVHRSVSVGNGNGGLSATVGSTMSDNTVRDNAGIGINVGSYSTVQGNAVTETGDGGSGDDGINAGNGSTITDNTVQGSSAIGIDCVTACNIARNAVYNNLADGIQCSDGCTISENASFDNGDAAGDDGIQCSSGCNVIANTVRQNTGEGLNLSFETGYAENVLSNNAGGNASGGVNLGGNLCDGVVCP